MSKTKYKVLLGLFIMAFIASAALSFVPIGQICGGTSTTCYAVQNSRYESILGLKNASIGLVAFALLIYLAILQIKHPNKERKDIIKYGVFLASIIAIFFLYIQFFVLHAVCKYCMVVDVATLISLGIVAFWKEK